MNIGILIKERIRITAYGDVLACLLIQVSYGNVLRELLKDIYQRMLNMDYLQKYSRMCKHAFDNEYYDKVLLPIENEEKGRFLFLTTLCSGG